MFSRAVTTSGTIVGPRGWIGWGYLSTGFPAGGRRAQTSARLVRKWWLTQACRQRPAWSLASPMRRRPRSRPAQYRSATGSRPSAQGSASRGSRWNRFLHPRLSGCTTTVTGRRGGFQRPRRIVARTRSAGASAARYDMSSVIVLPLSTVGEYFPFRVPEARGFEIGNPRDRADLFRGYLEGIAFVERMAMNAMTAAGAEVDGPQRTMGGGAANPEWLRIRASVLRRPVTRPRETSSAFGAAISALAGDPVAISPLAREIVTDDAVADPSPRSIELYEERFASFQEALTERGYLEREP